MQDQLKEILQQQLRDVDMPQEISWWPLALGWWILIALATIVAISALIYLLKKRKRNRYRKAALAELQAIYSNWQNDQQSAIYLQSANAILKRCLLHLSNDAASATRTGEAWIAVLNSYTKQRLSPQAETAIGIACYQADPQVDIGHIQLQVSRWIKSHHHKPNASPSSATALPEQQHA